MTSRVGGYAGYWAAVERELTAQLQPLDAAVVSALPSGTHTVEVTAVEWRGRHLRITFTSGRRTHTQHYDGNSGEYRFLRKASGFPERVELQRLLGCRVRVTIRDTATRLMRSPAGHLVLIGPAGPLRRYASVAEAVAEHGPDVATPRRITYVRAE